jgi:hypothetical protein
MVSLKKARTMNSNAQRAVAVVWYPMTRRRPVRSNKHKAAGFGAMTLSRRPSIRRPDSLWQDDQQYKHGVPARRLRSQQTEKVQDAMNRV